VLAESRSPSRSTTVRVARTAQRAATFVLRPCLWVVLAGTSSGQPPGLGLKDHLYSSISRLGLEPDPSSLALPARFTL
jgi:hypothetical protein